MSNFLNGTDPGLRQTRTPTTDNFAAGVDFTAGSTTQLTLSADPGSEDNVEITFDGIQQHRNTYSVSGTTVTFDAAIGVGVSNVEATFTTTIPAYTPADGTVTAPKLAGGTVGAGIGYAYTPYNAGTKSSGTFTPNEANGNFQYAVNGGAHTLAPPTNNTTITIQYTNDASAGTITTSGFTIVDGDALTTTNGDDFFFFIVKLNGFSSLTVKALQ